MKEKKILERLKKGDVSALNAVIELYTPYLYAIVTNIIGGTLPGEDAEEIVSDSFVSLWYNASKLKEGKLKSYLAAIARNAAISRLRAMKQELPLEENIPVAECSEPETQALINEMSAIAKAAVDSLPEPDREIFKRHYFLFQKTGDISREMGIKHATVRTKLARGRERLKRKLEEWGYDCENTYI